MEGATMERILLAISSGFFERNCAALDMRDGGSTEAVSSVSLLRVFLKHFSPSNCLR